MPCLDACIGILRRLIAKGDIDQLSLAERAIREYWAVTPVKARLSGLRLVQEAVLAERNTVAGDQRNFADIVNIYIERQLEE